MKTKSEKLFEELCARGSIQLLPIEESNVPGERRPDYMMVTGRGTQIIVEIKQFDPNPAEAEIRKRVLAGEAVAHGGMPGERVRRAIRAASSQLKAVSRREKPALLVVYDNVHLGRHTHPYAILTAMRGLDVVDVVIPESPHEQPRFLDPRTGPRKKMTDTVNTSISGVAVLKDGDDGLGQLAVFHNKHAANKLPTAELKLDWIQQFEMSTDEGGWVEVR